MRNYLRNRFYWRGSTPLGVINTILAFLFNRVVVMVRDTDTGELSSRLDKASDHPPGKSTNWRAMGDEWVSRACVARGRYLEIKSEIEKENFRRSVFENRFQIWDRVSESELSPEDAAYVVQMETAFVDLVLGSLGCWDTTTSYYSPPQMIEYPLETLRALATQRMSKTKDQLVDEIDIDLSRQNYGNR